jgi:hypothetical protein
MKSNGIEKENNNLKDSLNNDNNIDDNLNKSEESNNNNNCNIIDEDKDNKEAKNQKMGDYSNIIKSNDFKIIDNYNNNEFNKEAENIDNEIIDFEEEPIAKKNLEEKYDIKDCNEDNNKDNNEENNGDNNKDKNTEIYNNNFYNEKIGLNGSEENYDEEEIVSTKYLEIEERIRKKENIITYLNNKKKKEEGKNKYSNKNIKVKNEDNLLNNGMNKINNYLNEKDIIKNQNGNLESSYNQNYNIENIEINQMINENNLNGNDNPNDNYKYSYEKNDFKYKKNLKNNGVEIINNYNNNEINNENKLNELNSNQNRIIPKYEVIEISLNEKKGRKTKTKIKEKKEKNDTNKPQMPINVISSQEINSSNNLIDDIQNLIIKSKQKVANDLDKIEKMDKKNRII